MAAEAARLLTRLWAPVAGRGGGAPWSMPVSKAGGGRTLQGPVNNPEDNHNAQQAKAVALKQPGRYARQLSVGRRGGVGVPVASKQNRH